MRDGVSEGGRGMKWSKGGNRWGERCSEGEENIILRNYYCMCAVPNIHDEPGEEENGAGGGTSQATATEV